MVVANIILVRLIHTRLLAHILFCYIHSHLGFRRLRLMPPVMSLSYNCTGSIGIGQKQSSTTTVQVPPVCMCKGTPPPLLTIYLNPNK